MDYTARLPVENLIDIFHIARFLTHGPRKLGRLEHMKQYPEAYCNQYHFPRRGEFSRLRAFGWITVTHVCARWRAAAIGTASFWTHVPLTLGIRWVRLFVVRSQQAPLSIDWDSGNYSIPAASPLKHLLYNDIVPNHYPRMRTLRVCKELEDEEYAAFFVTLNLPWPTLEDVDIENNGPLHVARLFDHSAPCLRSFRLSSPAHCHASKWMAPYLYNLTLLELRFAWGLEDASMYQFLEMLDRMSDLRHLRIQSSKPERPPDQTCSACASRTVAVPLHTFSCHTSLPIMVHIMQHIILPTDARVLLCLADTNGGEETDVAMILPTVCSLLLSWFAQSGPSPFTAVGIVEGMNAYTPRLNLSRKVDSLSQLNLSPEEWYADTENNSAELSIDFPRNLLEWETPMMNALSQLAPRAGYRALTIDFEKDFPDDDFQFMRHPVLSRVNVLRVNTLYPGILAVKGHLPALKVLDIHGDNLYNVYTGGQTSRAENLKWKDLVLGLCAKREDNALRTVYLHNAEEIALVRDGRFQ